MKNSLTIAIGAVLSLVGLCPADQNLTGATNNFGRWSTRADTKPVISMLEVSFAGVEVIGRDSLGNPLLVSRNTVDLSSGPRLDLPLPASKCGPAVVHADLPLSLPNTGPTTTGPELLIGISYPPRPFRN